MVLSIMMHADSPIKSFSRLAFGLVLLVLAGGDLLTTLPEPPSALKQNDWAPVDPSVLEVPGRTQSAPGRKGIIAPVPLHPVVEVLVAPGDRVTKGQALVRLDADEARADVRAKQAELENARIALEESRRYLEAAEKTYDIGALPEQKYHEARVATLHAEKKERAGKAALDIAQAELDHYVVTASIDGVISWLDVYPGMVSRPGTTVWGEILDLSDIDVRCELTLEQADRVFVGQAAEVRTSGKGEGDGTGRVVFVGITADKGSGLVPVVVRLPNLNGRLRSGVRVQVRFNGTSVVSETK